MDQRTEIVVRLACFAGVCGVMALWEGMVPRRRPSLSKVSRWGANLGLAALNSFLVRLLLPLSAVQAALVAEARGWGMLHHLEASIWLEIPLALLAFDLLIYAQHVLFHAAPLLWRAHQVHHADIDLDVTSGVRFHFLEILASALLKLAAVFVIGPPAVAVLLFEVVLNATSLFHHANVRLPLGLDRFLRWWLVTPDMHRVHHSTDSDESNRNFGFNLPWWDFLFRTYRAQPIAGHENMLLGLPELRDQARVARLSSLLALPFASRIEAHPPVDPTSPGSIPG